MNKVIWDQMTLFIFKSFLKVIPVFFKIRDNYTGLEPDCFFKFHPGILLKLLDLFILFNLRKINSVIPGKN
jgi:hypothetical protein